MQDTKIIGGVFPDPFITVKEFARRLKISEQAVTAALRKGKPHAGISAYGKRGHQWVIQVERKNSK